MARYNEILVGRYARAIQKLFSMKGEVPVASLAGELQIVHQVFNGNENRYLEGWNLMGAGVSIAGAATFQSGVRLRNPIASGVLAVITKFTIGYSAADTTGAVTIGTTGVDLATVAAVAVSFDSRVVGRPALVLSVQNTTVTVPPLVPNQGVYGSSAPGVSAYDLIQDSEQQIPLLPGSAIQLTSGPVNQGIIASFFWRERTIEDSEKA